MSNGNNNNIFLITSITICLIIAITIIICCISTRREKFSSTIPSEGCPSQLKRITVNGETSCGTYECDNCISGTCETSAASPCSLAPSCPPGTIQIKEKCVNKKNVCKSNSDCQQSNEFPSTCSSSKHECICSLTGQVTSNKSSPAVECGTKTTFNETQIVSLEAVGHVVEGDIHYFTPNEKYCLRSKGSPDFSAYWTSCVDSPNQTRIYPQIWAGPGGKASQCNIGKSPVPECENTPAPNCGSPTGVGGVSPGGISACYLMDSFNYRDNPSLFIINNNKSSPAGTLRPDTRENSLAWAENVNETKNGGNSWWDAWQLSYPCSDAPSASPCSDKVNGWGVNLTGKDTYITDYLQFSLTNTGQHNGAVGYGPQFICYSGSGKFNYQTPDTKNTKVVFQFKIDK